MIARHLNPQECDRIARDVRYDGVGAKAWTVTELLVALLCYVDRNDKIYDAPYPLEQDLNAGAIAIELAARLCPHL